VLEKVEAQRRKSEKAAAEVEAKRIADEQLLIGIRRKNN
jgi:hypothetical protein